MKWSPFGGSGVTTGTSPRDSFHYHSANIANHPQEETQGSGGRHGHTKGHIPLAWGREDEWLGGLVVGRASQIA